MRAVHLPPPCSMNPSMVLFAASEKTFSPSRAETALAIVGPSEHVSACSPRTHTRRTGSGAASAVSGRPTTLTRTAAAVHQANRWTGLEPGRTAGYGTTRRTPLPRSASRSFVPRLPVDPGALVLLGPRCFVPAPEHATPTPDDLDESASEAAPRCRGARSGARDAHGLLHFQQRLVRRRRRQLLELRGLQLRIPGLRVQRGLGLQDVARLPPRLQRGGPELRRSVSAPDDHFRAERDGPRPDVLVRELLVTVRPVAGVRALQVGVPPVRCSTLAANRSDEAQIDELTADALGPSLRSFTSARPASSTAGDGAVGGCAAVAAGRVASAAGTGGGCTGGAECGAVVVAGLNAAAASARRRRARGLIERHHGAAATAAVVVQSEPFARPPRQCALREERSGFRGRRSGPPRGRGEVPVPVDG
jgi:hypothetical protein